MSSPPPAVLTPRDVPSHPTPSQSGRKTGLTLDMDRLSAINFAQSYISEGQGLNSVGNVSPDGRISIHLDLEKGTPDMHNDHAHDVEEFAVDKNEWNACPQMNIVIMIVGSRGDVQPYVALGKRLVEDGHRVRLATHETFHQFVTNSGLEFFNIGGNPQDLMSYMVKNPGLVPGFDSLTNGDIAKKRKMLTEMIDGCWEACHAPCPLSGRTFAADAIISNPPTFAHVHCAEALGIPLLLTFTMPWSPTIAFAHPLVNITTSNPRYRLSNYLSYGAADLLTWQGIGDIINLFRTTKLGLSPLNIRSGPGYVDRLKIPWTYCISPALVPKPSDWKNHIDVVGFYFLDLATAYQPPPELVSFLEAGPPPVYIGFGSVVVDDPAALSKIIFEATEQAGVRALVSAGWGGLGGVSVPPHIFMLGNIPHDWLFDGERVSAVVHHGGAGTTAIGLAKGRPTVVIPFFGDQAFWGKMIHKSGAGPKPINHKDLTVKKLRDALIYATGPVAKEAASTLAQKIHDENGINKGVEAFYRHLPLLNMRCDLDPSRLAVWWSTTHCLKLSAFAAQTLADANLISMRSLILHRSKEYRPRKKPTELGHAGANALFHCLTHETKLGDAITSTKNKADQGLQLAIGIKDVVTSIHDNLRQYSHHKKKSEALSEVSFESDSKPTIRTSTVTSLSPSSKEISVTPPVESVEHHKLGLIGCIRHYVHNKKVANLALLTSPMSVQGTWKMLKSSSGQMKYDRQRLTRIAEGRAAVRISTSAQRAYLIERFHAENAETPLRQELYRNSVAKRGLSMSISMDSESDYDHANSLGMRNSTLGPVHSITEEPESTTPDSLEHSPSEFTLVDTPQGIETEDDTSVFVREMELAIKKSLAENERNHHQRTGSRNHAHG